MKLKLFAFTILTGCMGGAAFCLFFLLTYIVFDNPFAPFPKSLDFFIYLFTIVGSLAFYRFRQNQGNLKFGEGIFIGIAASILMGGIFASFFLIFLQYIDNQLISTYINYYLDIVQENKKGIIEKYGQSGLEQMTHNLKQTSAYQLAMEELKKIPVGIFISLFTSALLRK